MRKRICIIMFAALLLAFACNVPERKQISDRDFDLLLAEAKKHVEHYPDSAFMILYKLLPRQSGEEKTLNRGKVLNLIGSAYDTKGMYDSAAYYLYEASRLAEKIQNDTLQISVYTNLGVLQFDMNNVDEAIKYYQQALPIAENLKDSIALAKLLNNIGNAYMTRKNDFLKAIPYFEKCVEICQKIEYILGVKVAGINLAMMYNETGEPDKAMREAQKLTELYGPNIYADFTVAQSFHQKKQYGEAVRLYLELLQKPLNSREFELAILKDAASAYQSLNDLDNAIYYLEKSYSLRDSLHNQQTEETIHNLKIAYETEKKEAKIATLEDEKRLMIWLGIVGGIVLLLALTTFFFLWRWTVQKKCLAQSQRELAEQQIKQLQQEKQLIATQAVLDGEIQERTRIARDLHDGLGSLLSAVSLHINEMNKNTALNSENTARFDKAMRMLDEAISEMRRIAHHLMPDALSRFGLKMALTDFCNSIPVAEFIYFGNERRLAPKMEELVYRIANELINNALKHSGASHILVQIVQEADRLALTVEDNGKGFNPEVITTGMGLANVRTRVASFGGTIDIRSSAGSGTEINIEFQL